MTKYKIDDGWDQTMEVEAETAEKAVEKAWEEIGPDFEPAENTYWADITAFDPEDKTDSCSLVTQIDPVEPDCEHPEGHNWIYDTARGHGGGVITWETCSHCGVQQVTDTWGQRPDTGEQGFTTVEYLESDDEFESDMDD